jgi:uncharacterized protein YndB with AHSA1/START domain
MSHYQQTLVINAEPSTLYAALASEAGLRGWWTANCAVATHVGGLIKLRFGETSKDMSIECLDVNRQVRWFCTRAHIGGANLVREDEWVGTEIVFRLTPTIDGKTRLDFEHIGLVPGLECYDLCNNGWNYFLASLQQYAETGRGTPWSMPCAA